MADVYVNGFIQPFVNGVTTSGIKVANSYVLQADANGVTIRPGASSQVVIRAWTQVSSYAAQYTAGVTPGNANYTWIANSNDTIINAPSASGNLGLAVGGSQLINVRSWGFYFVATSALPADGSMGNSTAALAWDGTNLKWKKKDGGGVVTTGNVF